MATNYTEHYQLNQWEPEDKVLRTDFNEDNLKIDGAIKAEELARADGDSAVGAALEQEVAAREAAVAALETRVAAIPRIAVGSYVGDGAASRTISLGFTPRAVFVIPNKSQLYVQASNYYYLNGGLAVAGSDVLSVTGSAGVAIVPGGFRIAYLNIGMSNGRDSIITNTNGTTYHYMAFE